MNSLLQYLLIVSVGFLFPHSGQKNFCGNGKCDNGKTRDSCPRDCVLESIRKIKTEEGRVDWAKDESNLVVFDKKNKTGFYQVYLMTPDGNSEICLTCDKPGLPQKK